MTTNIFRIIIVLYRNGPEVQTTLDALAAQTEGAFEVIIIDNNCPNKSANNLTLPDQRFHIIRSRKNLGFSGGCNVGARYAKTPWLIMLNPDAHPLSDWLAQIKLGISRYDAGMYGSTQIFEENRDLIDGFGDVWSIFGYCWRGGHLQPISHLPDTDHRVLSPCAAASVYKRELFEKVGGFDEEFFCYLEDVDLGIRMQAVGSDCIQLRFAQVLHVGGASQQAGSDYALLQSTKNTSRLIFKNAPALLLPIFLTLFILSQIWFKFRNGNASKSIDRWKAFKEGILLYESHLLGRKRTVKNKTLALIPFIAFSPGSVRKLPIKSRLISKVEQTY